MKATLCIVALPLLAFVALAQDPPPPTQPTTPAKQDPKAKTATPTQDTQKQDMQKQDSGRPDEMKTQSYSGTLMDASCAGSGAATTANTPKSDTAAASGAADKSADKSKATGDANRAATDQGQACSVSSSTAQFALKLKDGRVVKLDDVGNQRAQETLKNKKKWSEDAAANKPIHASVSGVLSDDRLLVMSIK
jgi:hypothetical protein